MLYPTGHTTKTNSTAVKSDPILFVRKPFRLLGKLASKPLADRLLLLEVFFHLAFARFLILLIPIKYYHLLLEHNTPASQKNISGHHFQLIQHIQRNIRILSNYIPWRAKCFEQSIALKLMMKRRGVLLTLVLGVLKNNNALKAHAWIEEMTTPYDTKFTIVKSYT